MALELKHEKNQTVHDAVAQFVARDHARKIFQHPFLYLAADTSDVMAATDPRWGGQRGRAKGDVVSIIALC